MHYACSSTYDDDFMTENTSFIPHSRPALGDEEAQAAAARNAQGSMMVAGPRALYDDVKAELAKMTGRLEYLGERPDIAAVNKLFGNAMILGIAAVTAMAVAAMSGLAITRIAAATTASMARFAGECSQRAGVIGPSVGGAVRSRP